MFVKLTGDNGTAVYIRISEIHAIFVQGGDGGMTVVKHGAPSAHYYFVLETPEHVYEAIQEALAKEKATND